MASNIQATYGEIIMSGYGLAVQQGTALAINMATGTKSAAGVAAYNAEYNNRMKRYALQDSRVAAERNITAVRKDKLLQDTHIQLKQNTVEAQIRANAAWVGAEGGSVEAVVYDTESSAARRMADNAQSAKNATAGQLTQVRSASLSIDALQETPTPSLGSELLNAFSKFSVDDWRDLGEHARGTPEATEQTTTMGVPINMNLDSGEQYA